MFNKLDHFRIVGAQGAKPPLVKDWKASMMKYPMLQAHPGPPSHHHHHPCQETGGHGGETQLEQMGARGPWGGEAHSPPQADSTQLRSLVGCPVYRRRGCCSQEQSGFIF